MKRPVADMPVHDAQAHDPSAHNTIAQASSALAVGREGNLDILICEDNEINQIVFKQILESMPYNYKVASNGKQGLVIYKRLHPKLILMDVSMPEMNGLEATREIRKIEQGSGERISIIGVTAHAIKGDMERCMEAGMDDYLSKPVSPDKLIEKIDRWMAIQTDSKRALA
ncbi:MAG: response regulator [Salaquimonas sp.]